MSQESPGLPLAVLSTLVDLGTELQAEEVDLPRVLELATRNAARLLATDIAWLSLWDDMTRTMHVAVSHGTTAPGFDAMTVSEDEGLGGAALQAGGPVIVTDYASWASPGPVRDAMIAEGVCSVVCAPMLRGERVVGVLYVGNRTPTQFTAADASIVTALAAQASVAIGNGLLYSSLLDKTRTLEATFEIHRALGEAAVSDLGIDRVMQTLSDITGRRLSLEQRIVEPHVLVTIPVADHHGGDDESVASVVSVRRNETTIGRITVFGEAPLREVEQNALAHGATVLVLELMKDEAAQDVEWRLRGELLEQLLEASDDRSEELVARGRRFGIDLTESRSVVVVEADALDPQALRGLIQRVVTTPGATARTKTTLTGQRGHRGVVALIGDNHDVERFVEALRATGGGATLWIGTSAGRSSVAASFREAAACSQLAKQASPSQSRVVHGSALGPLRFMLDIGDLTNARAFVNEVLGPVAASGQGGVQLLATLRAYVEEDGHHQRIADRCHVHVSTVKYRLSRISELLGRPLKPWETRFEITLAFRLADLLDSVSNPS